MNDTAPGAQQCLHRYLHTSEQTAGKEDLLQIRHEFRHITRGIIELSAPDFLKVLLGGGGLRVQLVAARHQGGVLIPADGCTQEQR